MPVLAWAIATIGVAAIQGLLVQTACVAAGHRSPPYWAAFRSGCMGASFGSLATVLFGWTAGLVVHLVFGRAVAWIAGVALGFAVTSAVHAVRLRIPVHDAPKVAAVHLGLTWAIGGLVWAVIRS